MTPPRLARGLLRFVVPKHDRIFVVEDLEVLGLGGAYAAAHAIFPVLFGVDPGDLRVYGVVTLILGAVTLLANFLRAPRAAGLDPMSGLRGE